MFQLILLKKRKFIRRKELDAKQSITFKDNKIVVKYLISNIIFLLLIIIN